MPQAQGAPTPSPLDDLVNKYEAIGVDPNNVNLIPQIDEIRRLEFINAVSRAQREKDPFMRARRMTGALQAVRQDVAYHAGKLIVTGAVNDEQKISRYTAAGTEYLNEKYNIRE